MVYVTALHNHYFLFHLFMSDAVTTVRVYFLTVYTFKFHRLVVDVEVTSLQAEFVIFASVSRISTLQIPK